MDNILLNIKSIAKSMIEAERSKKEFIHDYFYYSTVEQAEKIEVHSQAGKFPLKLFTERAPNQTQKEFNYIKANFKTITFPVWSKYVRLLNRIFNDANWSINYTDGGELEKYLNSDYPTFESLESYFRNIVLYNKEQDPNSVLVVKPYELPTKENANGEIVYDETKLIEPVCYIYKSKQVFDFKENEYCLLLSNEKTTVTVHDKQVKEGLKFEYYDNENIYYIYQVGKKDDLNFDVVLYYNHNLGYLPCYKLKGFPIYKDNKIFYQSSFFPAVDILDTVLLDNSYLTAQKAAHAFQHKWEYVDECNYQNTEGNSCIGGNVMQNGKAVTCPSCAGTGNSKPSILGVYQIKMPTRTDDTTKGLQLPPFGWEAPSIEIFQYLRDEIQNNLQSAISILGLSSNSEVKGTETALGKMIDREESFSILLTISNQIFELYEMTIQTISDMRFNNGLYPVITYPKTFAIRNESELTEELAKAKELGLPSIAYRQLLLEYLNKRFATSVNSTKMVDLAFYVDRLLMLTDQEIAQKKLNGSVATWEDILHTSMFSFVSEALQENENFFSLLIGQQAEIIVNKAKAKELQIKPAQTNIAETVLNRLAGQ